MLRFKITLFITSCVCHLLEHEEFIFRVISSVFFFPLLAASETLSCLVFFMVDHFRFQNNLQSGIVVFRSVVERNNKDCPIHSFDESSAPNLSLSRELSAMSSDCENQNLLEVTFS